MLDMFIHLAHEMSLNLVTFGGHVPGGLQAHLQDLISARYSLVDVF